MRQETTISTTKPGTDSEIWKEDFFDGFDIYPSRGLFMELSKYPYGRINTVLIKKTFFWENPLRLYPGKSNQYKEVEDIPTYQNTWQING